MTSIAPNDDGDDDDDVGMPMPSNNGQAKRGFNPVAHAMKEIVQVSFISTLRIFLILNLNLYVQLQSEPDYDPFAEHRRPTVGEKEDEYRQKRRRLVISPERVDPFADGTFPLRFAYTTTTGSFLVYILVCQWIELFDEAGLTHGMNECVCRRCKESRVSCEYHFQIRPIPGISQSGGVFRTVHFRAEMGGHCMIRNLFYLKKRRRCVIQCLTLFHLNVCR